MKDISIIIPHKNTPELLKRCLNSIPVLRNVEIIVIDDNSNRNIVDFNNYPGSERLDIKIIYTSKGNGAGYARNIGLANAEGKWIIFADADDFFAKNAFDIFNQYTDSDYDVIFFNAEGVMSNDTLIPSKRTDYYRKMVLDSDINAIRYKSSVPWAKMIRHRTIREYDIKFDETIVANDAFFSCILGVNAKKVGKDLHTVYFCTEEDTSLKMKIQSKNDRVTRYLVTMKCNRYLKKRGLNDYYNYPGVWLFKSSKIKDWLPLRYLIHYLLFFKKKAITDAYWFLRYN